jgi:hypothetical protein
VSEAEDAGSIVSELRLSVTQLEKDIQNAQKKMEGLSNKFKQHGDKAGTVYVQGFGKAQQQLNTRLNNMVSSLQGVSPKMGALGAKMASVFSKPIFSMVPAVSMAFQAMLPVIGTIIAAIGAISVAIKKVYAANKEYNETLKLQKDVSESLVKNFVEEENAVTKSDMAKVAAAESAKKLGKAWVTWLRIVMPLMNIYIIGIKKIKENSDGLAGFFSNLADKLGIISKEQQKNNAEAIKLKKVYEDIAKARQEQALINKNIDTLEKTNAIDKDEADKRRLNALNNYIEEQAKYRDEISRVNIAAANALQNEIAQLVIARDKLKELIAAREAEADRLKAEQELQLKITEARLAAIEKQKRAERAAKDEEAAGFIDKKKMQEQINASYSQMYKDLEDIVTQYKLTTGETVNLRNETAKLVKTNLDNEKALLNQKKLTELRINMEDTLAEQRIAQVKASADSAKSEGEKNRLLDKAIALENELIMKQRQRAREALMDTDEYIAASDTERTEILKNFDAITAGMIKVKKAAKDAGGNDNWLANLLGLTDEKLGNLTKVGEAVVSAYETISDSILEVNRQHAEEQMAIIDKALEQTLASIEKARNAELIASGFAVNNNIESLEAQLEAAKRTGDEVLIYQTERRLEEQRINDKFDAEAKAKQEEAAREKARIEYELAKQEHAIKLINAVNAGAAAILQALQAAPPPYNFILAALSGTAAGVQIGLIAKNPPKMPHFANSGIVPGNKFFGDRNVAAVDSGELILNRVHQDRLADDLTSRNTPVTATFVIMLDAKEIGRETFDLANKGHYTLKTRVIQG